VFKLPNGFWKIDIYKVLSFYDVTFLIIGLVFLILNFLRVLYFIKYSHSMQLLLYEESCVDPLTKAYNRRKLEKFDKRSNLLYTVCYMDIDKFKLLNDTYGHDVGDQVLIEFTKRLKSIIRIDDLVIRLGGDEFLIILFDISDLDELNIFRSRLDEVLKPSYLIKGLVLEITSSMAFAISSLDGETLQEVMDYADKEMYKIKKQRK
ncbi:MAG: GGDEF domain-containing protein, partial [Cetobacterium sp.]